MPMVEDLRFREPPVGWALRLFESLGYDSRYSEFSGMSFALFAAIGAVVGAVIGWQCKGFGN